MVRLRAGIRCKKRQLKVKRNEARFLCRARSGATLILKKGEKKCLICGFKPGSFSFRQQFSLHCDDSQAANKEEKEKK